MNSTQQRRLPYWRKGMASGVPIGSAPKLTPITITKTVAEMADAFVGFFDKTATHASVASWDWYSDQSTLTFYAKGTECILNLYQVLADGFAFSVDDGAWTLSGSGTGYVNKTIFTGQSDTEHLVRVVSSVGFNGGGAATRASGTLVTVTGVNASVRAVGVTYLATDAALPGQYYGLTEAAIGGSTTPNIRRISHIVPGSNPQYAYNSPYISLRGRGTEIWIYSAVPRARYAVDNAAWSDVTFPANLAERCCMRRVATGLDASTDHTYKVIGSINTSFGGRPTQGMALGPISTATYGTAPTTRKWAQFGDSITQGMNAAGQYTGFGDLFVVGQRLGFVPLHVGRSGKTAAQLDTDLGTILDGSTLTAPYAAVIAIGTNDSGTAEAAFKASYGSIIDKLLAAGVTKVLCRTPVPDNSDTLDATISTWIGAVVTSKANSNVVLIDATGWDPIDTLDGQHPSTAGYITMADYAEIAYAPYL